MGKAYDDWKAEKDKFETKKQTQYKNKIVQMKQKVQELRAELVSLGHKKNRAGEWGISQQQAHLLELLLDFEGNQTPEWLADQVGVSTRTVHKWRNDPVFMKALDKELTIRRAKMRLEAYRHLFRRVKFGNPRIIFKYLEMLGEFKQVIAIENEDNKDSLVSEAEVDKEIARLKAQLGNKDVRNPGTLN